jgi:phage shock protein E
MTSFKSRAIKLSALALISAIALSACAPSKINMSTVKAVIDVRTPSEYAGGHLQGAINLDVEDSGFLAQIETLTKSDNYVVYCHSGHRAGIAIDEMKQDGFTGSLTNAGGIDDASVSTNLPIVTN